VSDHADPRPPPPVRSVPDLEPDDDGRGPEPGGPTAIEEAATASERGSSRGLLRSSAAVALGTGLSRITGLGRTVVLAYALGTGALAEAYNLANTTPNMVYDLVLGGILAATLVPVVVARMERDDQKGIDALATAIVLVLGAMTVLAMLLAPLIIRVYGLTDSPEERSLQAEVAVPLLVLFLPQMLFYGLTSLFTALLNAKRSFAVPAFAPVLNNVVVICLFLALPRLAGGEQPTFDQVRDDTGLLWLLGLGTTAGIVAMTLVLLPAMRHAQIRLRWNLDLRHPAVREVARLSGWTLGYVVANQVAFFVITILANGTDGVSVYAYAWIFFQLLYGLWAVSVMTAYTPELATAAVRGDLDGLRRRFTDGFRLVQVLILPGAVGLALLAGPVVEVVLQRGAFDAASAEDTAATLAAFAVGLPFFSAYLFAMRGFYALRDTRTPFWINLGQNALNVVLGIAFVGPWGVQGLAGALSLSYAVGSFVALIVLEGRVGQLADRRTLVGMAKIAAASALLGIVVGALLAVFGDDVLPAVLAAIVGLAVYLLALVATRTEEATVVIDRLARLGRGGRRTD
jgi:putative peptidoglycan lipid II flippase